MKYLRWMAAVGGLMLAAVVHSDDLQGSLYDLKIQLTDQLGHKQSLDTFRGHPVWVILFYGSCPSACPLLIESVRANETALAPEARKDLRVLLVSIDPDRDTQSALKKLAHERRIDTVRWKLTATSEDEVRLLAAALGIQYRRLPNGDYNHTSAITLLKRDGEMGKQTSILGRADPSLLAATLAASARPR
ncbi:MAG TPA: SCO family protein [Steroidobacteraceae bacterium]|nr:SCO family protein [Steroidobacteraceae bacterium]